MQHQERIQLTDTAMTAAIKLADGNPGAITAIMKMMESAPSIDPDSAFGPLGPLFSLDSMGIYGSRIWVLWKDVCGGNALRVETLFRAAQLGIISDQQVSNAASTGRAGFDFSDLLLSVQEQLPAFGRANAI